MNKLTASQWIPTNYDSRDKDQRKLLESDQKKKKNGKRETNKNTQLRLLSTKYLVAESLVSAATL